MNSKFEFLKTAFTSSRLSEEEELELLKQYKENGDKRALRKLKMSLRPLLEKAVSDNIPSGKEDTSSNLLMTAQMKLPDLLKSYDPSYGTKLKTHILSNLNRHMQNTVSETMVGPYVPRNQHNDLRRYRQSIRDAEMEFGKNPTDDQIRSFYPKDAQLPFDKIKQYHVKSYMSDAIYGQDEDNDGVTFKDQFSSGMAIGNNDLFSGIKEDEIDKITRENFNPEEQKIIKSVAKDGNSFVQTSLTLGSSTAQVRKVMRRWYELTNK